MPYLSAELKFKKSKAVTNTSINGGRMIAAEYVNAVRENVFPLILESDRANGITLYRKIHCHLAKSDNSIGLQTRAFLTDITPGDTASYIIAATHRNTQGDISGTERKYAAGRLNSDVSVGDNIIVANFDLGNGANQVIQNGDMLWLSNGANEQFLTVSAITWVSDQATITTTETAAYNFLVADNSTCASVLTAENVTTSQSNWSKNTTSGVYDETTYPLLLEHLGAVEQTLTFTMTDSANFNCVSDSLGNLGAGSLGANFAPVNPDTAAPYFTLRAAGFSGTWQAGESFSVQTHPAAVPLFWIYQVNSGAAPIANDNVTLSFGVLG